MDGQTIVGIVVGALFLAGLIGALIPWIPGPLFILIGVLVWAVATQFAVIGVGRLVILVTLALTTLLILPFGRWVFARAEHSMRVRGTLGQY